MVLEMINQEVKRDLDLNLMTQEMINQEVKRDLDLNLMIREMKIERNLNIHLNLKNITEVAKIKLFKI